MHTAVKRLLGIVLFGLLPLVVEAQTRQDLSVSWGGYLPTGSGFVKNISWTQFSLQWDYRIIPQLKAGLSLGYVFHNESGWTQDHFNGAVVTGNSNRKLIQLPIQMHVSYYPIGARQGLLQPYLGVGIGGQWARFDLKGAVIQTSGTENWGLIVTPQIGMRIYPSKTDIFWLEVKVAYRYATNEWKLASIKGQQGIIPSLGVGISF